MPHANTRTVSFRQLEQIIEALRTAPSLELTIIKLGENRFEVSYSGPEAFDLFEIAIGPGGGRL